MQEAAEKNDVFLKKCCDDADADLLEQEQENAKLLETIKQLEMQGKPIFFFSL